MVPASPRARRRHAASLRLCVARGAAAGPQRTPRAASPSERDRAACAAEAPRHRDDAAPLPRDGLQPLRCAFARRVASVSSGRRRTAASAPRCLVASGRPAAAPASCADAAAWRLSCHRAAGTTLPSGSSRCMGRACNVRATRMARLFLAVVPHASTVQAQSSRRATA